MKIDLANTTVTESNVLDIEEVEMKFSESALPHLTRMFVNLYNNPDEAVYREILFNAIDATKKAGTTENIEVYLPTSGTPVLTIIDKGVGMSLEDLKRNSQFGGTDKNGENDSVGGFGLGFKSPLSITSQFSVESIKNGERTVVTISNSEDGICRMSVLLREETDLPNGTTVSVPVKNVSLMREVAVEYSKYVPDVITYFNRDGYPYFRKETHYTEYTEVFEGFYDTKRYYDAKLIIVMGGVPYTVNYNDLYAHIPELRDLFRYQYVLEAPIGSITLSPNREGVQFNQKTKDTIKDLLLGKLKKFVEESEKSLEESETYLEALRKYSKSNMSHFLSKNDATWNGVSVNFDRVYLGYKEEILEDRYGAKYRKKTELHLSRITKETTISRISSVPLSEEKILLVEPHEEVSASRFTYLVRQYFLKNDLSFDDITVFRSKEPFNIVTASDTLDVVDKNDDGKNLLIDTLEYLKQDHEVISILDIKNDLAGWKAPKNGSQAGDKPKVKYLDREVDFLSDNSGVLEYSKKTLSEIIGEGNKKIGIYEAKSKKDEYVNMTHFETEVFNKFITSEYNLEGLEGVIILRNNAKPDVLIKNTEKFGNTYVTIEDFYRISKFREVDRVREIFDTDVKPIDFYSSWGHQYVLDIDTKIGKIKDKDLREIIDKGSVNLDPDDRTFLTRLRVGDTKAISDIVKNYLVDVIGMSESEAESSVNDRTYSSVVSAISDVVDDIIGNIVDERYRLADRSKPQASLEYMNMMFDHKYSK